MLLDLLLILQIPNNTFSGYEKNDNGVVLNPELLYAVSVKGLTLSFYYAEKSPGKFIFSTNLMRNGEGKAYGFCGPITDHSKFCVYNPDGARLFEYGREAHSALTCLSSNNDFHLWERHIEKIHREHMTKFSEEYRCQKR